jgi:hypothetical protein
MDYTKMKVAELKKLCKKRKIKGYSKMRKKELVDVLERPCSERIKSPSKKLIEKRMKFL